MNLTVPTPAVLAAYEEATRTGRDPVTAIGLVMFGVDCPLFDGDPEWTGPRPTWSRTHYARQLAEAAARQSQPHADRRAHAA